MNNQIKIIDLKKDKKSEQEKIYREMKKELLVLTNKEREKEGLKPLCLNEKLNKIAQIHSDGQFKCMQLSHSGCPLSKKDKKTLIERIESVDYNWKSIGENVAFGYRTPESVMEGWMNSEGHRKNILNPKFKELGFGIKGNFDKDIYWTQVFGTSFQKIECE